MKTLNILFGIFLFVVFYTYLGYGILLYALVKIKYFFHKTSLYETPSVWPEVTLFITAYNEEDVIDKKMDNCLALHYPKEKLHIVWITDGSDDNTNVLLSKWKEATVYFQSERQGKMTAMNRGMQFIETPYVVYTDANTILNADAIKEIIKTFSNPKIGCVAGEKVINQCEKQDATQCGESSYWKYESALKALDSKLYSTIGAAGELFAIRRELYIPIEKNTLLDDFVLSLRIAMRGYKIAYCKQAYAIENGSANIHEEEKRKIRIAAGGLQSIWRLRALFNPFRYHILSFQFLSHRVLRWSITPVLLFALLPMNIVLLFGNQYLLYSIILLLQILFYIAAIIGYFLQKNQLKYKIFFIPYYFFFMNINVFKGVIYLCKHNKEGVWEKSYRRNI